MNNLTKRIITGIIIILGIFSLPLVGQYSSLFYWAVILVFAVIGLYEFYYSFKNESIMKYSKLAIIVTILYFFIKQYFSNFSGVFLFLSFAFNMIIMIFDDEYDVVEAMTVLTGVIYVPIMLSFFIDLNNKWYFYLVFILAFTSDSFAFVGGNLFGRHKLCPSVSPNKTIEGSVSGLIATAIACVIFGRLTNIGTDITMLILGVTGSIFGQLGDLVASKIKRHNKIKDYGWIFPGHGGVMDRFDSVIFIAPLVYYFVELGAFK